MKRLVLSIALVTLLPSCGRSSNSELSYELLKNFPPKFAGIYGTTKICMTGPYRNIWRTKILSGISPWVNQLKKIDPEVSQSYLFTCINPDYTLVTSSKIGRAHAFSSGKITLFRNSDLATVMHEFGHAFAGLADTYVEGTGRCKTGQPLSLMCSTRSGARLLRDDILGLRKSFSKYYSLDRPTRVLSRVIDKLGRVKKCAQLRPAFVLSHPSINFENGIPKSTYISIKTSTAPLSVKMDYRTSSQKLYLQYSKKLWEAAGGTCPTEPNSD